MMKQTEAGYLELLRQAKRDPVKQKLVEDLIMDEETMAPLAPFRLALARFLKELHA